MSSIPEYTLESLKRYKEEHIKPGGFLCACIANDFVSAARKADLENSNRLADIGRFIGDYLPKEAWGSYEALENWLKKPHRVSGAD